MEEITSLNVHNLDGEFYHETREYLEKQGCTWSETRGNEGELLTVHLDFPPGTTVRELESSDEKYKRHQVIFKSGALAYWSIKRADQTNNVAVPYVRL